MDLKREKRMPILIPIRKIAAIRYGNEKLACVELALLLKYGCGSLTLYVCSSTSDKASTISDLHF
jgi:hypothetical protein